MRKECDQCDHTVEATDTEAFGMLANHPITQRVQRDEHGRWVMYAPAKLNLGLRIFPARADGFHDLETWMAPLSWHDTLTITPGLPLELVVLGRSEGVPTELEKNLVGRAALKLAKEADMQPHGKIELFKVLPPGGGLGGGSSDAAHVLVMLNDMWHLHLSEETLARYSAELGSDVPFFVRGVPSLCTGRGEIMQPMRSHHTLFAVLILPPLGLATGPVFKAFDEGHRHLPGWESNWNQWATFSADELNAALFNDLEPGAFFLAPWLKELQRRAAGIIGRNVHMTGSGSTLFTLCDSAARAAEIQAVLAAQLEPENTCLSVRLLHQR